ncbi:HNH endonuclease [Mycolicibacter terrae]|uniref:HNH endonuclease n=1 Tax=Mycolicibacter terrae TaxID=1788 RepID=UPI001639F5D1|nr:HNH endonuclease [Mycolicibacter terrae]
MLERNRRDNEGRCQRQFYGCLVQATTVNHKIERIDGGTDDPSNLEALCEACHYRLTVDGNRKRAAERRAAKKLAKRKNHPGRKDRYDP